MRTLKGVAASPGASVAPAIVHRPDAIEVPPGAPEDAVREIDALREALDAVGAGLEERAGRASGELAEVLGAQAMMARDPELAAAAEGAVSKGARAARAVLDSGETFASALDQSEDEYMAARAADIRDVCRRVARLLVTGSMGSIEEISAPSIVVATELPPADVAELDRELVAGIATQEGSRTSHTAIVARALGIPAVVAVPGLLDAVAAGEMVAVDGDAGEVHVEPDEPTNRRVEEMRSERGARRARLRVLAGDGPGATRDGHRVEVAANVGATVELVAALEEGAEAVGLLRTELLYLDRREPPEEDEQLALLAEMVELLGDRRLVVRTFDFGADKPVPFLETMREANPALGVRGIRLARAHPELLDTQLRAVARAAERGAHMAVMAPMVATLDEARWFADRVEASGGRAAVVEMGAMVEVPSAVLVARELASELDFLSIGTNDLTQYLHAADRQQGELAHLQDPFSPPLLRAVARVCDEAGDAAWVGVCGEAAADVSWALIAVGLGVSELSVGADAILQVRAALSGHTLDQCRRAARAAVGARGPEEARAAAAAELETGDA